MSGETIFTVWVELRLKLLHTTVIKVNSSHSSRFGLRRSFSNISKCFLSPAPNQPIAAQQITLKTFKGLLAGMGLWEGSDILCRSYFSPSTKCQNHCSTYCSGIFFPFCSHLILKADRRRIKAAIFRLIFSNVVLCFVLQLLSNL